MRKPITPVFALSIGAMLASCASFSDADTTRQTNRATYELPLGHTYDINFLAERFLNQ
jgi:hypothetical protein